MRQPTRPTAASKQSGGRRKSLLLIVVVLAAAGGFYFWHNSGVSHSAATGNSTTFHHKHHAQVPPITQYAQQSLSVLDNSSQVFNQSVAQVAGRANLGAIGNACGADQQQVGVLSTEFNGVPHQGPWYYRVGHFHHRVMGAYHYMLGAMTACGIAASNGDPNGTAQAVSDMTSAAQLIRRLDRRAHWLAHQKK